MKLPAPLRSAVIYAFGIAWARGLSLLMVPLMTATLSPSEFGRLDLLSSAAEVGGLLVSGGMLETLFRFASGDGEKAKHSAASIVGLAFTICLISICVLSSLNGVIANALPLATSNLEILLLSISISLEAVIVVTSGWMRIKGKAGLYVAFNVLRATVQSAVIAYLLLHGWGLLSVIGGGAVVTVLLSCILAFRQWRETGISFQYRSWGGFLVYSLPLIGAGLSNFATGSADRWFLAPSITPDELGRYALATKFALLSALLLQPFELWWYPKRIGLLKEPDGIAKSARAVDAGVALSIVACAMTSAIGPALIYALTPISYHGAASWVPWLSIAVAFQASGNLCNVGIYAGRTAVLPFVINGCAAAVAVGGYIILIPHMGAGGAVAATVAAQMVRFTLMTFCSLPRVKIPHRWLSLSVLALCGLGSASSSLLSSSQDYFTAAVSFGFAVLVAILSCLLGLVPVPIGSIIRRLGRAQGVFL